MNTQLAGLLVAGRRAPELHIRMVEAWLTGQEPPSELRPEPTPSASAVKQLRRRLSGTG